MKITRQCPVTGNFNTMDLNITEEQMESFNNGTLIQKAFPHLSAEQREFILTGFTPEKWKEVFGEEE